MHYDPEEALAGLGMNSPVVIGQIGQTLDGRIATESGQSLYINGQAALTHLHHLRASVDAVIVGVGTILSDNPRLTVRLADGKTPTRVILDPAGRAPVDSQCFHDRHGPIIVIRDTEVTPKNALGDSVEIIELQRDSSGLIPWTSIMTALGKRGLFRVLVEGGPRTLSLAMQAGIVDQLHVMVAPKILGSGKPALTLPPIEHLADALSPKSEVWRFADGDMLFVCDLRLPREAATTS